MTRSRTKTIKNTGKPQGKRFVNVVFNAKTKLVRNDKMAGRDYLVVPMVMLTEGVHAGSEGPYLYQASEIAKRPSIWNKKPVVVGHPDEPSACTPEILSVRQIGDIMNAKWDGKNNRLTAEAWLDEDMLSRVDKENTIHDAIKNGETLELSTGLFADSDEEPGEWNGEAYQGTLKNFGPDHLAVLPDAVGACSIEDGAGFYRNAEGKKEKLPPNWSTQIAAHFNELSQNTVRDQLHKLISESKPEGEWRYVEDVYDSYFIWSNEKSLFQREYEIDGDVVRLKGLDVSVIRKFTYEPIKNATKTVKNQEKKTMEKKTIVDGLIAKNVWKESDRERLMALDEDVLTKMVPAGQPKKNEEDPKADTPKPETEEQMLARMPSVKNRLDRLQKQEDAEKDRLITIITANKKSTFKPDFLKTQDLEMLQNLANLAGGEQKPQDNPRFNYGMNGGVSPQNDGNDDDVKEVPLLSDAIANQRKQTVAA